MARAGKVDFSELKAFVKKVENELGGDKSQRFIEACAKELAARLLTKVIKRTPVGVYNKPVSFTTADGTDVEFTPRTGKVGGTLRRGWTAEKQQNVSTYVNSLNVIQNGNVYTIEIINPVEYAPYVEFGHRTVNGGWVEGRFMLTISEQEIREAAPKILEKKLQKELEKIFK